MELVERFTRTWTAEASSAGGELLPSLLARAAARVLSADGAGLSLMSGPGLRLPLGASSDDAATAERLQFSVGEGPCFEAYREGRPVTVTPEKMAARWPVLATQHLSLTPFRASISTPLRQGAERFGVLDVYLRRPEAPEGHDIIAAQLIAEVISGVLLETLGLDAEGGDTGAGNTEGGDTEGGDTGGGTAVTAPGGAPAAWLDTPAVRRRRDVWVAVGMANLMLRQSSDDALATLRGHAYATGCTLDELAHEVVEGNVDLEGLRADVET